MSQESSPAEQGPQSANSDAADVLMAIAVICLSNEVVDTSALISVMLRLGQDDIVNQALALVEEMADDDTYGAANGPEEHERSEPVGDDDEED